jgi:pimeloyl-ACP methyl ester carboxylesterase
MIIPSLLLIHGSVSGAWVWRSWRRYLGDLGWQVNVLDLRGHGRSMPADLSTVTMEDYVADVASVTRQIEAAQGVHPILGGWSMGGMVAMMYAAQPLHGGASPHTERESQTGKPQALLLLSSYPPLEVAGRAPMDVIRQAAGDVLGPEAFGIYSDDRKRSRTVLSDLTEDELTWFLEQSAGAEESGIATRQCLRGISVPKGAVESPSLVLYGEAEQEVMRKWAHGLAGHLGGDVRALPGVGHWGLVCHDAAVAEAAPNVDAWLRAQFGMATHS